jgi:nitrogen fixation/metabolism regulation signal transduction histidine kinase
MEVGNKLNRSPLDRVLGRLDDLDEVNLGILVQRLARERKLLETVFDVIRDGVLVLDDEGFLTYSNQQGRTLIGLKDNNSEKINIRKASPEIARTLGMDRTQDSSYPEVVMREMQITYPETRQLRIYAVPIERSDQKDEKSNKAGLAVVMTDVTEELDDLNAKIESEKVSSIMDLAAGVAHELGNPLNSINIHLQLLQRNLEANEKSKKSLHSCIKEVQRLDGIISHFLKAIRPTDPDLKKINLLQIIEETVRLREKEIHAKKISVSMEAGVREPMIHADAEQIKQVFFNVIGNALDAVGENSDIRIITGIDDTYVFAKIVDQGSGIKKENISRVFEPYFTTKKSGHGIGMMIVHRIMRDHGGEVGIDSKEGSGTIVTLNFPRKSIQRTLLETSNPE